MFKRINNWHLTALVAVVSIFSIALIQQYAFAQWTDPSALPGTTSDNRLVINPMTEDLQLGVSSIVGSDLTIDGSSATRAIVLDNGRQLCLGDGTGIPGFFDCKSEWPSVSGGVTGSGTIDYIPIFTGNKILGNSVIKQDSTNNNKVVIGGTGFGGTGALEINRGVTNGNNLFTLNVTQTTVSDDAFVITNSGTGNAVKINDTGTDSTPFVIGPNGRVGIGTANPQKDLHIFTVSGNAEINIHSNNDPLNYNDGKHWGIYQSGKDGPLKFWKAGGLGDQITFSNTGDITAEGQICDSGGSNCIGGVTSYWSEDSTTNNLSRLSSGVHLLAAGQGLTDSTGAAIAGVGEKLIWYPNKSGAFRVGLVTNYPTAWDDINIGQGSVAFGVDSIASNRSSTVGGGWGNQATGDSATVSGGGGASVAHGNIASGNVSSVGGGTKNIASGYGATVAGGDTNVASGEKSFIGGGWDNIAGGDYSFSGGRNMQLTSTADNTFVWGAAASPFSISQDNAFLIFPTAPPGNPARLGFGTASPATYFHINANDTGWDEPFKVSRDGSDTYFFLGLERNSNTNNGVDIGAYSNAVVGGGWKNFTINRGGAGNVGVGVWGADLTKRFMVQGDIEARGDIGVESVADTTYNYIQLDLIDVGTPPATDCDASSEYGRMMLNSTNQLMLCGSAGWRAI